MDIQVRHKYKSMNKTVFDSTVVYHTNNVYDISRIVDDIVANTADLAEIHVIVDREAKDIKGVTYDT